MAIQNLGAPKQTVFSTRAKTIKQAKRAIENINPDDPLQNLTDKPNQTLAQNTLQDTPQDTVQDTPQDVPQDTPQDAAQDPISESTPLGAAEPDAPGASEATGGAVSGSGVIGGTVGGSGVIGGTASVGESSTFALSNVVGVVGGVNVTAGGMLAAGGGVVVLASLGGGGGGSAPPPAVDSLTPTITSVVASDPMIISTDAGTIFNIAVTFSEAMNTAATPTLIFTPEVTGTPGTPGTLTQNVALSGWSTDKKVYTTVYNVTNVNVAILNVTVDVTGAQDAAGNAQQDYIPAQPTFSIDTLNPAVVSVVASDPLITDADVGAGTFNIAVTFDQAMNPVVVPTLTFTPAVTGTLTQNGLGVWSPGNTIYTVTYNVADANVFASGVTVDVTSARNTVGIGGTLQSDYPAVVEFGIDTQNPTVVITIVAASLSDILNTSNVTFTFNEAPVDFVVGDIIATNGIITGLVPDDATHYHATFTVADGIQGAGSVTVNVSTFTDAALNANLAAATSNTVVIDTVNPTVTIDILAVSLDDTLNTSKVIFTFSEDPGTSFVWNGTAGDVVVAGGTLGALVQDIATTYHATFTANDNFNGTGSVTVNVGVFTDVAGNGNLAVTSDTVAINTVNPTVASVLANPRTVIGANAGSGTFSIAVTFSEAMIADGSADPLLTFSQPVDSTLTLINGAWSDGVNGVNSVYTATYNVIDANVVVPDVMVDVAGAKALVNGGLQQDYTPQPTFSIYTAFTVGVGDDLVQYHNLAGLTLDAGANGLAGDTLTMSGTEVATVNLVSVDQTTGDSTIVNNFENIDASLATVTVNLTGSAAVNVLQGGSGNDSITGGGDADTLSGGDGDDTFNFASQAALAAAEIINGGVGNDCIQMTAAATLVDNDFATAGTRLISSIETLGLTGASIVTLGARANDAGIVNVVTGTGATTINRSGVLAALNVNAAALPDNTVLTLTGTSAEIVANLVGNITASALDGTLTVTTGDSTVDNAISITTGTAATLITGTAANDTVSVNTLTLAQNTALTLAGAAAEVVTNLVGDVQASALTGALTITTGDAGDNTISVTTGSAASSIIGTAANDVISTNAAALAQNTVLTLAGASAETVTNLVGNITATTLTSTLTVTTGDAADNGISIITGTAATSITGTVANDTVTVIATALADNITLTLAGAAAETVTGLRGNITATGLNGALNVTTVAVAGLSIATGSGSTTINASALADAQVLTLTGSAAATVTLNGGDLTANTYTGNLTVIATTGSNIITTGTGNDTITGGAGVDAINSGTGVDTIIVNAGHSTTGIKDIITGFDLTNDTLRIVASGVSSFAHGTGITVAVQDGQVNLGTPGTVVVNFSSPIGTFNEVNFEARLQYDLTGTAANDTIRTGGLNDALRGGEGADTLTGGAGADIFIFNDIDNVGGQDLLMDFVPGEDLILLRATGIGNFSVADDVIGSGGFFYTTDIARITSATILWTGNNLAQSAQAQAVTMVDLTGTSGADILGGGVNTDILRGGAGADTLTGGGGADTITGGTGADTLVFGAVVSVSSDSNGGPGAWDTVTDFVAGTDFVLIRASNVSNFSVATNISVDVVAPSTYSADLDVSDVGDVNFFLSNAFLTVAAAQAATIVDLTGTIGDDTLVGGGNADILTGGEGVDTLTGEAGADTFVFNANVFSPTAEFPAASDSNAGVEDTIVDFTTSTDMILLRATNVNNFSVEFDVFGVGGVYTANLDKDVTVLGQGDVVFLSTAFNGDATAAARAVTSVDLWGTLDRSDILGGGANNDILNGDLGSDTLTGGLGADQFIFNSALGFDALIGLDNIDTIMDFEVGTDLIMVEHGPFGALGNAGVLPGTAIGVNNFISGAGVSATSGADVNAIIKYDTGTGNLFYDADGNGAGAMVHFATLDNIPTNLTAASFIFI